MSPVNKILIVRFSSLGDIILTTLLIRTLRRSYPDALIDYLVKSEYADILRSNPHLSAIIQLRSSHQDELKRLAQKVRAERYDLILDLHNSLRSRYLRTLARARAVKIVRKRVLPRTMLVNFKRNYYTDRVPVPIRYLETAARYSVVDDGAGLEVFVPEDIVSSVSARLNRFGLDRYQTVIGVVPGARHFTKQWPMERFVEFGVKVSREHKAKLLVFGSTEESEYCGDIAHMINAEVGTNVAESLGGIFSILETASAMEACSVVVTNDTGLMHLAAARRRPVVALFGSTVEEFGFFPFRTTSIVLERKELPCRPCSHVGRAECPEGHFKCMRDIAVLDVLEATRTLIVGSPVP